MFPDLIFIQKNARLKPPKTNGPEFVFSLIVMILVLVIIIAGLVYFTKGITRT